VLQQDRTPTALLCSADNPAAAEQPQQQAPMPRWGETGEGPWQLGCALSFFQLLSSLTYRQPEKVSGEKGEKANGANLLKI